MQREDRFRGSVLPTVVENVVHVRIKERFVSSDARIALTINYLRKTEFLSVGKCTAFYFTLAIEEGSP